MDLMKNKKGQVGFIVTAVIALIVAVILLIGVFVPILTNVTGDQGFTGVNLTISNNLVTFVLLAVLVMIAGLAVMGFRSR